MKKENFNTIETFMQNSRNKMETCHLSYQAQVKQAFEN